MSPMTSQTPAQGYHRYKWRRSTVLVSISLSLSLSLSLCVCVCARAKAAFGTFYLCAVWKPLNFKQRQLNNGTGGKVHTPPDLTIISSSRFQGEDEVLKQKQNKQQPLMKTPNNWSNNQLHGQKKKQQVEGKKGGGVGGGVGGVFVSVFFQPFIFERPECNRQNLPWFVWAGRQAGSENATTETAF